MDSREAQVLVMNRQEILNKLKQGIWSVTFTKVNGEIRTMPCTLKEELLPPARKEDPASQKKIRALNEAVIVAYCMDKREWRSFRVDNVTSIKDVNDAV